MAKIEFQHCSPARSPKPSLWEIWSILKHG